jgi:hypothetical protein
MVSMGPYTQRYDYTYRYTDLCNKKPLFETCDYTGTIYDLLEKDKRFSKTIKIINMGLLKAYLTCVNQQKSGLTLFVTEDKNIPDSFMNDLNVLKAEVLINSYMLPGIADESYLIENGSSVYFPRKYNPVLVEINGSNEVLVNKVGKLKESIPATNGYIHVLDNLADVSYVN